MIDLRDHIIQNYLKRCTRQPVDFGYEVDQVVLRIANSTSRPIHILFSGGIDSEVVVQAFMRNKVPFTAVFKRYNNTVNFHDMEYAVSFAKKHNINFVIEDCDVEKFIEENKDDGSIPLRTLPPSLGMHWLRDKHNQGIHAISCGGEQVYTQYKQVKFDSNLFARNWICKTNKWDASASFFNTSAELYYCITNFAHNYLANFDEVLDKRGHSIKEVLYHSYFDLTKRPKYTGFEHYEDKMMWFARYRKSRFPSFKNEIFIQDKIFMDTKEILSLMEFK